MPRFFNHLAVSGGRVCWRSVLLAALCATPVPAPAQEAPLTPPEAVRDLETETSRKWTARAAADALRSGFTALAARLFEKALKYPDLSPEQRQRLQLDMATALISEERYAEAGQLLADFHSKENYAYLLRKAMVDFHQGKTAAAGEALEFIYPELMEISDRPWYHLLSGLLAEARGEFRAASRAFAKARETAPAESLRLQFETFIRRHQLLSGQADESIAASLKSKLRDMRDQHGRFDAARLLAIALHQMDRKKEAVEILEEQLLSMTGQDQEERAQLLFLLGLIAGHENGRGRLACRELLETNSGRDIQKIALRLLARAPSRGEGREEFTAFLTRLIERPRPHPLKDELCHYRAQMHLAGGDLDKAEADARRLLDEFPGSPLKQGAIRLLVYLALRRDPPQYRTAADLINRLREETAPGETKTELGIFVADCYYLNEDYENAAAAYETARLQAPAGLQDLLLYQCVLSLLQTGRLEQARTCLDQAGPAGAMSPLIRWQAEYNLIAALKKQGQTGQAFDRLDDLLKKENERAIPMELHLRLVWLQARLSLEVGQVKEVFPLIEKIFGNLAFVPESALDKGQRRQVASHALLLKARAFLRAGQPEKASPVFGEIREQYADSEAAILSYLIEARYYAEKNRLVDAQLRLITLADKYPESPCAPVALWESALNAEQRGLNSTYQEAVTILERLINSYPEHFLVYYARLKQAGLSRKLNDFPTALLLYENLINQYPAHPERHHVEISRADCLLALGSQSPGRLEDALMIYEKLTDNPALPLDLRTEAGFKWALALRRQNDEARAQEVCWLVLSRFLKDVEVYPKLGARGRYWLSRAVFELAASLEKEVRPRQAARVRKLILDYGLPGRRLAQAKTSGASAE